MTSALFFINQSPIWSLEREWQSGGAFRPHATLRMKSRRHSPFCLRSQPRLS